MLYSVPTRLKGVDTSLPLPLHMCTFRQSCVHAVPVKVTTLLMKVSTMKTIHMMLEVETPSSYLDGIPSVSWDHIISFMGNCTFFMTKYSKWGRFTDILTVEYFTPDGPNGQTLLGFTDFCFVLAYSVFMFARCVCKYYFKLICYIML